MRQALYPHDKIMAKLILPLVPRWITPNQVTWARFFLTPFVWVLLYFGAFKYAIILFVITAFTDMLDGSMARVRRQVTAWGTVYDPVADKLLIGSCVLILTFKYLPWWITALIVALEIVFLTGGFIKKKEGIIMSPSWWGKNKMIMQVVGVTLLLVGAATGIELYLTLAFYAFIVAIILATINIFKYGLQL